MNMFEKWKQRYERHWCTKDQLKQLVEMNVFTEKQYQEITDEKYTKRK